MMFELLKSTSFSRWAANLRDKQAKKLIAKRLIRVEQGSFGDVRSVGDGVHELKVHHGPGYRIYFQVRGNKIVLLLCGGDKSSQAADIERAKSIARSWES
jgi:putative addiction module killer protein